MQGAVTAGEVTAVHSPAMRCGDVNGVRKTSATATGGCRVGDSIP